MTLNNLGLLLDTSSRSFSRWTIAQRRSYADVLRSSAGAADTDVSHSKVPEDCAKMRTGPEFPLITITGAQQLRYYVARRKQLGARHFVEYKEFVEGGNR